MLILIPRLRRFFRQLDIDTTLYVEGIDWKIKFLDYYIYERNENFPYLCDAYISFLLLRDRKVKPNTYLSIDFPELYIFANKRSIFWFIQIDLYDPFKLEVRVRKELTKFLLKELLHIQALQKNL